MRPSLLFLFVLSLGVATPCHSEPDDFVAEAPTPLKLVNLRHGHVAHFVGRVRLSGEFFVGWELVNGNPARLRAVFFPDADSSRLLPHDSQLGPVQQLLLLNSEEAASLLLDPKIAKSVLAKELSSTAGEAIVTIGRYRTVIDCDRRWYLADLLSSSKSAQIASSARADARYGC